MLPLVFALLQMDPAGSLLNWMDKIAQGQLDARDQAIARVRTRDQAEQRQRMVRAKILDLIGGLPDYDGPLNARVMGSFDAGGYTVEKVIYESLPNYLVSANVYIPKTAGKHPGILFPIGHWDQGKPIAQRMCGNFALKGFVCLAYDPMGQGERLQAYDPRTGKAVAGGSTEQHILAGAQSLMIGKAYARYHIWDAKRSLDYLLSRADVDAAKIGCTGCSGGGTITTYISALDGRIKVAAPACYTNSWRLLFTGPTGDSEQSIPGFLAAGLDMADYPESFAPKPWLMISTEQDFFTPAGAKIVYDEAKKWFGLFDAADRVKWVVGPGGHGTPLEVREPIYAWMQKWLQDGAGSSKEQDITLRPDFEFQASAGGQVGGRETREVIQDDWTKLMHPAPVGELAPALRKLIDHHAPTSISRSDKDRVSIGVDTGLSIEGRLYLPQSNKRSPAVVIVGLSKANQDLAAKLAAEGEVALVFPPRGTPSPPIANLSGDWITNTRALVIGKNLPAMRAHDILSAVDFLAAAPEVDPAHIRVVASGNPGIWALMAAAIDPRIFRLDLDRTPQPVRSALAAPVTRGLHDAVLPGFWLQWDVLSDLAAIVGKDRLVWRDPVDWMGNIVPLPEYKYSTFAQ